MRPLKVDVHEPPVRTGEGLEISVQRQLLLSARSLTSDGHFAAAVVAAQTASEVFMEGTLRELFQLRKIDNFWGEIGAFIPNYNIAANKKLRRLYTALSGDDDIAQKPFWRKLVDHVELRNDIVHDGNDATEAQSEASYAAVDELMNHINGVLAGLRTSSP